MKKSSNEPRTGEDPEDDFARALAVAKDPRAEASALQSAAIRLVALGAVDEADEVIQRLERSGGGKGLGRLKAASRHLRRSGVLSNYQPVDGRGEALAGLQELLISRAKKETDRLIVVFSGRAKRFWLSLQLLNRFLEPFGAHIAYLSDYTDYMFFKGLSKTAPGYAAMVDLIRKTAADLGAERLFVMANSGGGFIGLRAAAELRAEAFLGLSIRTDFSRQSGVPRGEIGQGIFNSGADEGLLINLRPYLADRKYPKRALLMCGDSHAVDVAHAENLRGLPRFEVLYLPKYSAHDVVSGLLARGQFEPVLARFLGESGETP